MDYTESFLQYLHTHLQNTMIALPADKKSTCLATLHLPGVPVDPSAYDENGLTASLKNLLDNGVHMQAVYSPADSNLYRFFGEILRNAQLPPGKELSREEKQRLKIAETYISNPLNNSNYQKYYDKYLDAQAALASAKGTAERRQAQINMKKLNQEWASHGKQKYEEYSNIVRELHVSSPASYYRSALDTYELYSDEDLALMPANWYSGNNLAWTSTQLKADEAVNSVSSHTTSTDQKIEQFYKSPGIWSTVAGWFGIKKGVTVTRELQETVQKANTEFSSSHMNMKWDMIPVSIQRPWLDLNVLAVQNIKMSGVVPGGFSTGELSGQNKGTFPGYITEFIAAKNIKMTMTLSKELSESLKKNISSITCGPLSNGNGSMNIVESAEDSSNHKSKVNISTGSEIQIIGFIIRPFPCFPTA